MMTKVTFVLFRQHSMCTKFENGLKFKMDKNFLRYSMFFHRGPTSSLPARRFSKKPSPDKVNPTDACFFCVVSDHNISFVSMSDENVQPCPEP